MERYNNYEVFSEQVYSKKFREELKRTDRKIKRDGYEFVIKFEKINEINLNEIRRIAKSKEVDGKSYLYGNVTKEAFHLHVYKKNPSNVLFLKFNNQVVAYATCIDWNGERIGIDSSFDRYFRKYGVGIQCIDACIKNGFMDQKQKYSFGLGVDSYKFRFSDQIQQYFMCYDYKIRFKVLLTLPYLHYQMKKKHKSMEEVLKKEREYLVVKEQLKVKSA